MSQLYDQNRNNVCDSPWKNKWRWSYSKCHPTNDDRTQNIIQWMISVLKISPNEWRSYSKYHPMNGDRTQNITERPQQAEVNKVLKIRPTSSLIPSEDVTLVTPVRPCPWIPPKDSCRTCRTTSRTVRSVRRLPCTLRNNPFRKKKIESSERVCSWKK